MAVGEERDVSERFQVWVRRSTEPADGFSLRFEVREGGKGILRVARPGVLVDPPARPSGHEERLTASQIRASRFLHVWDGGRFRQSYLLVRLEEVALEQLPAERWIELLAAAEAGSAMLLLPNTIEEPTRTDDEPTWPRRQMMAELRRELQGLGAARPFDADAGRALTEADEGRTEIGVAPVPEERPEEPRATRSEKFLVPSRARTLPPTVPTPPVTPSRVSDDPRPGRDGGSLGGLLAALDAWIEAQPASDEEGDRTVLMGGSALARDAEISGLQPAPVPALPSLPPIDTLARRPAPDPSEYTQNEPSFDGVLEAGEAPEEDVGDPTTAPETLEAAPGDDEDVEVTDFEVQLAERPRETVTLPPEPEEHRELLAHERVTTLVRFLRRQIASDRLRIVALEQQVQALEAQLAEQRATAARLGTR